MSNEKTQIISKERLLGLRYLKDGKFVPFMDLWLEALPTFLACYDELKKKVEGGREVTEESLIATSMLMSFGKVVETIYDKDAMVQAMLLAVQDVMTAMENWITYRRKGWMVAKQMLGEMRTKLTHTFGAGTFLKATEDEKRGS